jgi:sulfur relay (sulfurtransferase) DsrC/TusE family protein
MIRIKEIVAPFPMQLIGMSSKNLVSLLRIFFHIFNKSSAKQILVKVQDRDTNRRI